MSIGNLKKMEIKRQLDEMIDSTFKGFPAAPEGGVRFSELGTTNELKKRVREIVDLCDSFEDMESGIKKVVHRESATLRRQDSFLRDNKLDSGNISLMLKLLIVLIENYFTDQKESDRELEQEVEQKLGGKGGVVTVDFINKRRIS